MTRRFTAEVMLDAGANHCEGPLWPPIDLTLDGDVGAGLLHRFDPTERFGRAETTAPRVGECGC